MRRFEVGDLVIGNEHNRYNITGKYTVCKVVRILSDDEIEVRPVKHICRDYKYSTTVTFNVSANCFRRYSQGKSEIETEIEILEKKLKELKQEKVLSENNGTLFSLGEYTLYASKFIGHSDRCKSVSISDILEDTRLSITTTKEYNKIEVTLKCIDTGIKVVGVAKTHPEDDFNYQEGSRLAYYRALEKLYNEKSKALASTL